MTNYIKLGLDVVFLAKTSITKVPATEIIKEVRLGVKESGILN